jgi:predicted RNase H-like HicB family nuclease
MAKYVYPATFTKEDNGQYSVNFTDFESCYTGGDSLSHAIEMAQDVLCLVLYHLEEDGESIPMPSDCKAIKTNDNEFVSLIHCDTLDYRRFYDKKAVKKTLTIPAWLNQKAESAHVNFSGLLQQALKEHLQITE